MCMNLSTGRKAQQKKKKGDKGLTWGGQNTERIA